MASHVSLLQLEAGLKSSQARPRPSRAILSRFVSNFPAPRRICNALLVWIIVICSLFSLYSLVPPLLSLPPYYPVPDVPDPVTKDVPTLACHSHNDYWRRYPLISGLRAGCISTEADVWALPGEPLGHLYVGHIKASLVPRRTLKEMYLDPLLNMLEKANSLSKVESLGRRRSRDLHDRLLQPNPIDLDAETRDWNGVFDTRPFQSFTLLIDFKTSSKATFPSVLEALAPLRSGNWLTYVSASGNVVERPLTVVLTGATSFSELLAIPQNGRFVFFDAPLASLPPSWPSPSSNGSASFMYNITNSYYASTPLQPILDKTESQGTDLMKDSKAAHQIKSQITSAKEAGLKPRYWDTPAWPIAVRNRVWTDLWASGVGVLNVDDLRGVVTFWNT